MARDTGGDSLGDRMKGYEVCSQAHLPRRMPCIIRVDGKAFHTLTRGMVRPWDDCFSASMQNAAIALCEDVEGCKMAYWQSDEISLLLTDYTDFNTQPWFDKNVQKMVSVAASIATFGFNLSLGTAYPDRFGHFDARVFVLTKEEVANYFVWRQQDATRNSVQMLGRSYFSHKDLHGVTCNQIQDKLMTEKGINWNDLEPWKKRGVAIIKVSEEPMEINGEVVTQHKWAADLDTPIFTQDRNYIERFV